VAAYWRDLLNSIEADLIENKGQDRPAMLHAKLVVLDNFRIDYEKQGERSDRELGKIEFEAERIRKELKSESDD
jgi:hypothetical protein